MLTQAERRLKDTLHKKKERQMKTEEETGIVAKPFRHFALVLSIFIIIIIIIIIFFFFALRNSV